MVSVAVSLLGTTELMFIEPGVKINGAYYRDVLLGRHLLPAIRSVAGDFFTYNAPAHRAGDTVEFLSRNTPDFISPLLWPPNSPDLYHVDYEVWSVLQQRVAGFATSTTWNSVSWRSGVASTRTSLTEQFDSGVFDYVHVSVQTAATLSTHCNWCFCVRTANANFRYWKLLFSSSIFKTDVAQKLCGGFCWNLQRLRRKDDN